MEIKHKKPKYLITIIISGLILVFGLIGLLTYGEKYKTLSNVFIAFGSLGVLSALVMLLYVLLFVYEAIFDIKGVTIKKLNKEVFIDYSDINNLEYERPSIIKYILFTTGSLYPGTLRINYMNQEGKLKAYFVRIIYKDFERLPRKYKDLTK